MIAEIFLLLLLFQIKHFLCDFPLQGKYMLGKFKGGWDWIGPLSAHVAVHGMFTFLISLYWLWETPGGFVAAGALAGFDSVVHFIQDRIKASPNLLGRFKDMKKPYFWWALGQDQMIHHLTHYVVIWFLVGLHNA